ncbi:40S ribosomal protein S12, partial [Pseudoloma neurophilia]
PIIDDSFTLEDALNQITKISSSRNKLKRGIKQCAKSLLRKQSKLLIVSEECNSKLKTILIGLAKQSETPVILFPSNLSLLSQLSKTTISGQIKAPKCHALVIEDFVKKSEGRVFVEKMMAKGDLTA